MKTYHEKIFEEISKLIIDNLELLYNYNDETMLNIRKYCSKNNHRKYKSLSYNELIYFTEEALTEISNAPYLYDFRELE